MSSLIRYQSRLISQLCGGSRLGCFRQQFGPQLRNSSQNISEPVVSRKKKYIYTGLVGASLIAFGYYLKMEEEYGKIGIKVI